MWETIRQQSQVDCWGCKFVDDESLRTNKLQERRTHARIAAIAAAICSYGNAHTTQDSNGQVNIDPGEESERDKKVDGVAMSPSVHRSRPI